MFIGKLNKTVQRTVQKMIPKKTKMRRLINYIPVYSTFRDKKNTFGDKSEKSVFMNIHVTVKNSRLNNSMRLLTAGLQELESV